MTKRRRKMRMRTTTMIAEKIKIGDRNEDEVTIRTRTIIIPIKDHLLVTYYKRKILI